MERKPANDIIEDELDEDDIEVSTALIDEVNDFVAENFPVPLPSTSSIAPGEVVYPFRPEPVLTPLSPRDMVRMVVNACQTGEVILVGIMKAGKPEAKPYTAVSVAEDRDFTVEQLILIFETINADGGKPYWKLNPYDRGAIKRHAKKQVPEMWNGKGLRTRSGTWSYAHLSRINFFSGDHDVGRDPSEVNWEKRIPYDQALAEFWVKTDVFAAPIPTILQSSGRGFSPIWQIDPPVEYSPATLKRVHQIASEFMSRAPYIAADTTVYKNANPFIKAPGAIAPNGRISTYNVVGDGEIHSFDRMSEHFKKFKRWELAQPEPKRRIAVPGSRPRLTRIAGGPYTEKSIASSRAFISDCYTLLDHWKGDLTKRSNAFFRGFIWHRRKVLKAEVQNEAHATGEPLTAKEHSARVYHQLRHEVLDLNEATDGRVPIPKMNSYLNARFSPKPRPNADVAFDLGVTSAVARDLKLKRKAGRRTPNGDTG